jgi:hypothetical protein
MDWTIQDLGALGEFVGAIGVIITLIYLAYQIRQNTVQLKQNALAEKAAAVSASNMALRETRHSIYTSTEASEIYFRGNENPRDLSEVSLMRYRLMMMNIADVMLEIYTQTATTGFSPEMWETTGGKLVERVLTTGGGQWFWETFAEVYPSSFRTEVDRILQNASPGPE